MGPTFIVGLFVIVVWGFALIFLILTITFLWHKILRWIFGTLTVILTLIPILLFWGFEKSRLNYEEKFIGKFVNLETGNYLNFKEDNTWNSDTSLFDCSSGTWSYVTTEDMDYLELHGNCKTEHTFIQIYGCTPEHLVFKPDQNFSGEKPEIELKKIN